MTIHFGVLLVDPRGHGVQFQDVSPVDLIADLSNEYLSTLPADDAQFDAVRAGGIDLEMHYIADTREAPVRLTAGVRLVATDTYATCPRLDYLWIPGAAPGYVPSGAEAAFVRARHGEVRALFSVCTGAVVLGAAGVADGRRATGNRGVVGMLRAAYPKVLWSDEERWVVDEEARLWTCGGAQTAIDMLATYLKQHFDPAAVGFTMMAGDFQIREQKYPTAAAAAA